MKIKKTVKLGANADERESYLPEKLSSQETAVDNSVRKETL